MERQTPPLSNPIYATLGWLGEPATARARPARVGPIVRQRISEYNLGLSDWANDNCTSVANPSPIRVKRRIQTRMDTWEILLSIMEFTSVSDSPGRGKQRALRNDFPQCRTGPYDPNGNARRSPWTVQWKAMIVEPVIVIDPEVMTGTPCFRGTRVPFKNLMDYLEGGHSLGEFLGQFPTVTREMAVQALEEAKDSLLSRIA